MSRTYRKIGMPSSVWYAYVSPFGCICGRPETPLPCRKLKSVDRRHSRAVFCDGMPGTHCVHEGCRVDGGVVRLGWLEWNGCGSKKFYKMQTVRAVRRGMKRQIAECRGDVE